MGCDDAARVRDGEESCHARIVAAVISSGGLSAKKTVRGKGSRGKRQRCSVSYQQQVHSYTPADVTELILQDYYSVGLSSGRDDPCG